ncbi:hypothetical protein L873DRAFT_290015 [Choiromyces venosus 120613-1]|uniref:Uncharacterized protein n=1 Tax=Choiromyces venosus 120613-1 TaxID=1336337 RepID=A0A3N4J082_9PEZI|nr:hypothetical protein L873DRAFT_290015 [Choiromyces venosus 120613-1]
MRRSLAPLKLSDKSSSSCLQRRLYNLHLSALVSSSMSTSTMLFLTRKLSFSSEPRLETKDVPAYSATTIQFKFWEPPLTMLTLLELSLMESPHLLQ